MPGLGEKDPRRLSLDLILNDHQAVRLAQNRSGEGGLISSLQRFASLLTKSRSKRGVSSERKKLESEERKVGDEDLRMSKVSRPHPTGQVHSPHHLVSPTGRRNWLIAIVMAPGVGFEPTRPVRATGSQGVRPPLMGGLRF